MSGKFLAAIVLACCVAPSLQRCFSYHCPHHVPLAECIQGSYECQANEYCEVQTHVAHGNSPWVVMDCREMSTMADCLATYSTNDANCDPTKHDRVCHWCCEGEQCVRDLASGAPYVPPTLPVATAPPATTVAVQTTGAPAATTGANTQAATAAPPATAASPATAAPPATTQAAATGTPCMDVYLGDCSVDFNGRCGETLVQSLCSNTCGKCP